jgi:hypothetical protein
MQPLCNRAGIHLARRYRLHPAIADVVADPAGVGPQEETR